MLSSEPSVFTTESSGDGFVLEWETDDQPLDVTTQGIMKKSFPAAPSSTDMCDKQIQTSKIIRSLVIYSLVNFVVCSFIESFVCFSARFGG